MMKTSVFALVAAALAGAVFVSAPVKAQTLVDDWKVDTTPKTCGAQTEWKNDDGSKGEMGIVYANRGQHLLIVFGSSTWKFEKDETLKVNISFGDGETTTYPAGTETNGDVFILATPSAELLANLMTGKKMNITILGKDESYSVEDNDMSGMDKVLPMLDACKFQTQTFDEINSKK